MPPGEIKINHIESGNSDPIQRSVIVGHFAVEVAEIVSQFQRLRRCNNISRHFHRRICWQSDVQRTITYHVEQDSAPKFFARFGVCILLAEKAPSIKTFVPVKILVGSYALKENQFTLADRIGMRSK